MLYLLQQKYNNNDNMNIIASIYYYGIRDRGRYFILFGGGLGIYNIF